jgi:hypothetical protein
VSVAVSLVRVGLEHRNGANSWVGLNAPTSVSCLIRPISRIAPDSAG